MQFCLSVSNNVLHVFSLKCASFFEILHMHKTLYLLSRQHATAKTVISLQIQQIIDLLQRATFKKSVDFRLKPLKF